MLIYSRQFSDLVGIGHDRFEQRRIRERAATDVAAALGDDDLALMPIAPSGHGQRAEYDAYDATKLRAVVELERAGMAFGAACRFVRGAGISPAIMFPESSDIFAVQWLQPGGVVRRVCGSRQELRRAMPESPLAATTINITAVVFDVAKRAEAQLGLAVVGTNFARKES